MVAGAAVELLRRILGCHLTQEDRMTLLADPDRQARGVKLMLAVFGAILLAIGWFQWGTLMDLIR